MLPTPDVQALPYRTTAPHHRAPAPVQALRVVAWIELALLTVGVLIGGGVATVSATGLDASGEGAAWATAFVVFGLVFAGFCLSLALAVGIPLVLLRDGRPGRKTGALTTIVLGHAVVGLGALTMAVAAVAHLALASAFVPLIVTGVTATVAILALQPAARQWALES